MIYRIILLFTFAAISWMNAMEKECTIEVLESQPCNAPFQQQDNKQALIRHVVNERKKNNRAAIYLPSIGFLFTGSVLFSIGKPKSPDHVQTLDQYKNDGSQ